MRQANHRSKASRHCVDAGRISAYPVGRRDGSPTAVLARRGRAFLRAMATLKDEVVVKKWGWSQELQRERVMAAQSQLTIQPAARMRHA